MSAYPEADIGAVFRHVSFGARSRQHEQQPPVFVFGNKVFQCSDVNVKTASLKALGF